MRSMVNIIGVLLFLYSTQSWSFNGCKTIPASITVNTTPLVVQRDVPVGARLAAPDFTTPVTQLYTCSSTIVHSGSHYFGVKAYNTYSGLSSGGGRIYKTSIPGLGVQLGGVNSSGSALGWVGVGNNIDGNVNQSAVFSSINTMTSVSGGAAVTFYKIGDMTSGILTQSVGSTILGSSLSWAQPEIPINISGMSITVLACSLTTPTITVNLGDVYTTSFTGIGTTTGERSFDLGLNCNAGTKVNVVMAGTQSTDTTNTSVLALTGAGSAGVAKGIGAQILYNNSPLTIGSNLLLKTSAGGIETFPFKARYYQTLSNISPGTANATATLNITYQ